MKDYRAQAQELLTALLDAETEKLTGHERDYSERIAVILEARKIASATTQGAVARADDAERRVTELLEAENARFREAMMWKDRAIESGWGQ